MAAWQLALLFLGSVAVVAAATRWLTARLAAWKVIDTPGQRSSHKTPTPRGGGLAPVAFCVLAGLVASVLLRDAGLAALAASAAWLGWLGFADDRRSLPVGRRMAAQGAAVAAGLAAASQWPAPLGGAVPAPLLWPLLALGWVWFMNLFNFMDGIDGITGVELAGIGFGLWAVASAMPPAWPSPWLPAAGLVLAAAGLGFLGSNWHPARVFMGDAGSVPLGYLAGAALLALACAGQPAAALILPAYHVVDATLTLSYRALRREKLTEAHRSHAYQMATIRGLPHDAASLRVAGLNLCLIGLAVWSLQEPWLALALGYGLALGLFGWFRGGFRISP